MAGDSLTTTAIEERRIDGIYGEVWQEGQYQGDIMELQGSIQIEQRQIPRAGTTATVFRRGRVTRQGQLTLGKVDSRFEQLIIGWASYSVEDRRRLRSLGHNPWPDTWLTVKLDDPDSWGLEEIQLRGVKFWEISIGYGQGDLITQSLPFTWESESLMQGIARPGNQGHLLPDGSRPEWSTPSYPNGGTSNYPSNGYGPSF